MTTPLPFKILDACTHGQTPLHNPNIPAHAERNLPCRACAERAIEAAGAKEREACAQFCADLAWANKDMPDYAVIRTVVERILRGILARGVA